MIYYLVTYYILTLNKSPHQLVFSNFNSYWVMINFNFSRIPTGDNSSNHPVFFDLLPYFLLNQKLAVLVSTDNKCFSKTYYLSSSCWARFFLLTKLSIPATLTVVVDGVQFTNSPTQFVVQVNLAGALSDDRTSVYTNVCFKGLSLQSISSVFNSCVWLERELSDFTNINFCGLSDTRRLLLDYFEIKTLWQTHISNDKNFNNTLYDSFLAF